MRKFPKKSALLVVVLLIAVGSRVHADSGPIFSPGMGIGSPGSFDSASSSASTPSANDRDTTLDNRAAIWRNVDQSEAWTEIVLAVIHDRLGDLDRAKDIELFCPGYAHATTRHRSLCWLRIVGAIANFESDFIPDQNFVEPTGHHSIGLLALSPHECLHAPNTADLENPRMNLVCGTSKLADLVGGEDAYLDGPGHSGAAIYWSTLRDHYVEGKYHLGRKPEIIEITRTYAKYD